MPVPANNEQQVPGIAPPPVMSSDQILQHVDSVYQGLPDPVRQALDHAHTLTGGGALGLSAVAKPTPYNPQTGENYGGNPALHDLLNRPNRGMPEIQTLPAEKPGNGGAMQLLSDSDGVAPPPVESGRAAGPMIPGMSGVTSDMLKPSADTGDGMPLMPSRISIPNTGVAPPPVAHSDSMIATPPSAARQESSRLNAPPLPSSDPNAHTKLDTGRTGIGQIHNPWLRGLATAGDVIASGVFPNFGAFIPGTTAHHQLLVNEAGGAVKQENENRKSDADVTHTGAKTNLENAQTAELPAKSELEHAEAQNYISEAEARKNPDLQVVAHPVIDPNDATKTPRTGYFNKKTGAMTYGPEIAATPAPESNKPSLEKMDNGDIVAVHYDPATKKSSMEVVYHGDPKVEADIAKLEIDGKSHSVVVNKKTGATIKDLGETGEKPPTVNVNQGTWAIQEDAEGKPIEYNSKTGETRPVAAGGVQKAGTKSKADAAHEKEVGPSRDAMTYGEDYLKRTPTGSGDEALQEKFFELAKPSTGFRMTQPQMDMLINARSWMGSMQAHLRHATSGTWFNDQQRKEIVDTMRQLAKAKGIGAGESRSDAEPVVPNVTSQEEFDKLPKGATYMEDGKKYRKP